MDNVSSSSQLDSIKKNHKIEGKDGADEEGRGGTKKKKRKKGRAEEIRVTRHETVIGTSTMLRINRRRTRTRGVSPRGGFALSRVHRTRTRFLEELVDTDEKKKKIQKKKKKREKKKKKEKKNRNIS